MNPIFVREDAARFLTGKKPGALAEMKFFTDADDIFDARLQADIDEIRITGMNECLFEIVITGRRRVFDATPADVDDPLGRILRGSAAHDKSRRDSTRFPRPQARPRS